MMGGGVVVGLGKGILVVVGNGEGGDGRVLNRMVKRIGNGIRGVEKGVGGWFMLVLEGVFNLLVRWGCGEGGLRMGLVGGVGDVVGVKGEVRVVGLEFGDGLSEMI